MPTIRVYLACVLACASSALAQTSLVCPGDVDGDAITDTADITFVVSNLGAGAPGAVGTPGDADGDGETDTADVTFVVSNLGNTCTILHLTDAGPIPSDGEVGALLQSAIDTVHDAGGGAVVLPAGDFFLDRLIRLRANVGLFGQGNSTHLALSPNPGVGIEFWHRHGFPFPMTRAQGGYPMTGYPMWSLIAPDPEAPTRLPGIVLANFRLTGPEWSSQLPLEMIDARASQQLQLQLGTAEGSAVALDWFTSYFFNDLDRAGWANIYTANSTGMRIINVRSEHGWTNANTNGGLAFGNNRGFCLRINDCGPTTVIGGTYDLGGYDSIRVDGTEPLFNQHNSSDIIVRDAHAARGHNKAMQAVQSAVNVTFERCTVVQANDPRADAPFHNGVGIMFHGGHGNRIIDCDITTTVNAGVSLLINNFDGNYLSLPPGDFDVARTHVSFEQRSGIEIVGSTHTDIRLTDSTATQADPSNPNNNSAALALAPSNGSVYGPSGVTVSGGTYAGRRQALSLRLLNEPGAVPAGVSFDSVTFATSPGIDASTGVVTFSGARDVTFTDCTFDISGSTNASRQVFRFAAPSVGDSSGNIRVVNGTCLGTGNHSRLTKLDNGNPDLGASGVIFDGTELVGFRANRFLTDGFVNVSTGVMSGEIRLNNTAGDVFTTVTGSALFTEGMSRITIDLTNPANLDQPGAFSAHRLFGDPLDDAAASVIAGEAASVDAMVVQQFSQNHASIELILRDAAGNEIAPLPGETVTVIFEVSMP